MKWLERLKNQKAPESPPAKPTEPSFVGFVGTPLAHIQKSEGISKPEKVPLSLGKMGDYGLRSDPVNPDFEGKPFGWARSPFRKCTAIKPSALFSEPVASDQPPDPDRHCWPNTSAMNGREIDTFTARLARFTDKGVTTEGEAQAEKLLQRDRECDDRKVCLECIHLGGSGPSSWRCGNWRRAGVALRVRDADLPRALVQLLQRCPGFTAALTDLNLGNPK